MAESVNLRGRRVLVTGGTGFIGGRLVERLVLEWGATVRALVRQAGRAVRLARFPVERVSGDVTDPEAVRLAAEGCAVIFHCAYAGSAEPAQEKAVALAAARAVASAGRQARVERLVHVSTFSVYGSPPAGECDETTPWPRVDDAYAEAKQLAEEWMLAQARHEGLPVTVIQPTVVYGPWGWVWTVRPIQQLKSRRVVLLDGGSGLCPAVYVDDVTEALRLAATRPEAVGERFLISGAEPVTWREFYAAYEQMLGVRSTVPLAAEQAREELRRQRRARSTWNQLRQAIHSPKLHKRLRKLPIVEKLTPPTFWERLSRPPIETADKPLWIPDEGQFPLYLSRARYRTDKARERLGYSPRFNLEQGMALTRKWVEWANLLQ